MPRVRSLVLWLFVGSLVVGCGSGSGASSGAGADAQADAAPDAPLDATQSEDGGTDAPVEASAEAASDAAADAPVSCDAKAAGCATEFGSLFTKSNGRADGTLVALVRPIDQQCTMPNGDHAVLQLSMLGQVQRLVVSVDGVAVTTLKAPLVGPPFAEGWHPNVTLEYASDLGIHSTDFSSATMDEAVGFLCSHLEVGALVSVYAYSDGTKPSSAHQIHRNDNYPDGAVVIDPTSASPTYLLFRYADQIF